MAKKAMPTENEGGTSTMKSKTEVVKEFLAQGLKSPKEISAAAKETGLEIAPNYVSMIKSNLKKDVKKERRAARATTGVAEANPSKKSDLGLENTALKLALKAGSVTNAIAVLKNLE